jgi:hypothetical protein
MNNQNQFDRRSEDQLRAGLIEKFKEEFQDESHFDEWINIYKVGGLIRFVLQLVSLIMAATLIAYPSKYFLDSWLIGLPFAVFLLFFLEKVKRTSADVCRLSSFAQRKSRSAFRSGGRFVGQWRFGCQFRFRRSAVCC